MATFKRNGIYYARIKHPDGVWRAKTLNTRDPKVADPKYREHERRTVDATYRASHETSLADAVELFERSRLVNGCAEGTIQMYGVKCAHLLRLLGAGLPLARLAPPEGAGRVDGFIAARLKEGASRNTISKELTALRGLLKVAKRLGKFSGDLEAILPISWSNDYEPRRTALTPDQVRALVESVATVRQQLVESPARTYRPRGQWTWSGRVAAEDRVNRAAFVAFLVATGFRLSEGLRARREQIDLARGLVYCQITKTRKKGKREKWVPVTPQTRVLLERVLEVVPASGPMFRPWSNIGRDLSIAGLDVPGIPTRRTPKGETVAWVTPNDLRRTHANWLRNAGVDTSSIADVLGHVDSRMVERVYGKLRPEQLRDRVLEVMQ